MSKKYKLIIATTNKNKVLRIKNLISDSKIELVSLLSLGYKIPEPKELGRNSLEIAKNKAKYYYERLRKKIPVLAQDESMIFKGVKEKDNPGKDIKLPVIKELGSYTDENCIKYYSDLTKKYSGVVYFKFVYGISFYDGKNIDAKRSTLKGRLISEPILDYPPGYPITAIMQVQVNNHWVYYPILADKQKTYLDKGMKAAIKNLLQRYLSVQ